MIGTGVRERRLVSVSFTCKNCADRHLGCHSTCESYNKAKAEYNAQQARIREQKASYNVYREYKKARMTKVLYR